VNPGSQKRTAIHDNPNKEKNAASSDGRLFLDTFVQKKPGHHNESTRAAHQIMSTRRTGPARTRIKVAHHATSAASPTAHRAASIHCHILEEDQLPVAITRCQTKTLHMKQTALISCLQADDADSRKVHLEGEEVLLVSRHPPILITRFGLLTSLQRLTYCVANLSKSGILCRFVAPQK